MAKYKYRLSYKENKEIKNIDFSKLSFLKNKMMTDLRLLDQFTVSFNNLEEMINYLKRHNLISENIKNLFITRDELGKNNSGQVPVYNGDIIFYKNDIKFLSKDYIKYHILKNKKDGYFIKSVINEYKEKYENSKYTTMKNLLTNINAFANYIIEMGYDLLPYNEKSIYNEYLEKFIELEFSMYYKNVRDFISFLRVKEKEYNELITKQEERLEKEEFLTEEEEDKMYSNKKKVKNNKYYSLTPKTKKIILKNVYHSNK